MRPAIALAAILVSLGAACAGTDLAGLHAAAFKDSDAVQQQ
jgi:hypothetical protein